MSRPALIVGLGGTGQWVLTWLKRDLLLANNGKVPNNVRLLSIDTASQLEAGVRLVAGRQEEAVKLGNVSLGTGEFIDVGGDSRPLAQRVKAGGLSNIAQWYHAERWLDTLSPATFMLDDGAGRIRQFGRIAVFKDILGQETGSKIWRTLRHAIDGVRSQVNAQRRLEIMVVGSFAGGTGSGMFLDIALILRLLADQMGVDHILRGFFALPSVFTNAPDTDMKARTFAAWRELNRFMVVNSDFPMPLVEYVENNPTFRISPTQRIFDACYLVDGKRNGAPIAADAKLGVHPMVAEVISAILDEHAGTDYTQYIFTNLAPEYARTPDIPLYSALGSFTIQVPAHYKQEVSTLSFTKELLTSLLTPQDGSFSATGAKRHIAFAAPDQNQEIGIGVAGRERCHELLTSESITYGGESAKPTPFSGRIVEIVQKVIDHNQREILVNQLARAGGGLARQGGRTDSWIPFFTNLGDAPQFARLRRNVQAEVNYSFVTNYQRRDGQSRHDVRANFKRIPEDLRKRYGGLTAKGSEVHGSFGERLHEVQDFHLTLFRHLVRLRLLDMLMGRSDQDPLRAKSGKLGYAWDYFDGLVDLCEKFLGLMDEVKKRREEIKPEVKLQSQLENARRFMEQNADKTFLGIELPVVKKSENAFLQTQQRLAELRKELLLHHYVVETAKQMKAICANTRDAIQFWILHLSTGDDPSQISGLISDLEAARKRIEEDHTFDTQAPAVQRLVGDQVPNVAQEDVAVALREWEWQADYEGTPPRLVLRVRLIVQAEAAEDDLGLSSPTGQVTAKLRRQIGQENLQKVMGLGRQRFEGTANRTTVANEIKTLFSTPAQFASQVAPGAEPLIDKDVQASPRRKSNLIRVMVPPNDPYFQGEHGLEGHLRKSQGLNAAKSSDSYNIRVVNSENPYKLTLVRTDDLYPHEAFVTWRHCQEAYARYLTDEGQPQDPVLMHNFSAEAQAVKYEREFVRAGEAYRPLHPRLVMLLENPHALRQFLYLGMFGIVQEREERGVHRWELTWSKSEHRTQTFWLTRAWNSETDQAARPVKPDIMNAMHGYVIRRKTWQPGRNDRIDYQFADRLIKNKQEQMGPEQERKMLQHQLADGFIGWLKAQAYDPDIPERVVRQDLADLAKVAQKMLQERLEQLAKSLDGAVSPWSSEHEPEVVPKSRVELLLEQEKAVEQFLYLGMLRMVQPQQDSDGYRWQLSLQKKNSEEVYWVTPNWEPLTDRNRPLPDLMDAMEGYVLIRKSQQPGRDKPIDYEFVHRMITQKQEQLGLEEESKLLEQHIREGLVTWLTKQAYDPDVPERIIRPDFAELARAAKKMFQKRIGEIEKLIRPVPSFIDHDPFAFSNGNGATPSAMSMPTPPPSPFATEQPVQEPKDSSKSPWASQEVGSRL